jgi:hypothetical protein
MPLHQQQAEERSMNFCRTAALVALAAVFPHAEPGMAAEAFFSQSGSGSLCTLSSPCSLEKAVGLVNPAVEISCADSSDNGLSSPITKSITIDCAGTAGSIESAIGALTINGAAAVVGLRNFTIWGVTTGVSLESGTLILDNVHITGAAITAILAEPTTPSTLIVRNSVIDTGAAILLKPAAGGSLNATFDHVTITNTVGGGIKIDTTNGAVTLDIADSIISNNGGNGINAIGNAGGQAIVSIKNSVIARNGAAGIQANGVNAGVLIAATLLDQNAAGATSVVSGGNMFTYGNNQVVGPLGSGFTAIATLH